jgi:enoyl-CoA hydratase/carnithine racemase
MVLGREHVGAEQAVAIGLAAEACAAGEAEATLAKYRERLAGNGRTALSAVKRFLNVAPEMAFSALREYAASANAGAVSERYVGAP